MYVNICSTIHVMHILCSYIFAIHSARYILYKYVGDVKVLIDFSSELLVIIFCFSFEEIVQLRNRDIGVVVVVQ